MSSEESAEIRRLRAEVRELRRALVLQAAALPIPRFVATALIADQSFGYSGRT